MQFYSSSLSRSPILAATQLSWASFSIFLAPPIIVSTKSRYPTMSLNCIFTGPLQSIIMARSVYLSPNKRLHLHYPILSLNNQSSALGSVTVKCQCATKYFKSSLSLSVMMSWHGYIIVVVFVLFIRQSMWSLQRGKP